MLTAGLMGSQSAPAIIVVETGNGGSTQDLVRVLCVQTNLHALQGDA